MVTKERIKVISLVGLLVFSLLLSGRLIYNSKWVNANLVRQSQQIPGVLSVQTVGSTGQQELDVMTKNVQDLQKTSRELEKIAGKLPIRLLDNRNTSLDNVYKQMQFSLQEGIVKGNFTEMEQKVNEIGTKAGVKVNLTMDDNAIYLILSQDSNQLLSVLERHGDGKFLLSEGNSNR